jgi:hypothetical protein
MPSGSRRIRDAVITSCRRPLGPVRSGPGRAHHVGRPRRRATTFRSLRGPEPGAQLQRSQSGEPKIIYALHGILYSLRLVPATPEPHAAWGDAMS